MGRIKKIGTVEFEEADAIYKIFMRKKALEELDAISEQLTDELKSKLKDDIIRTNVSFNEWWDRIDKKYNFETQETCQWEIDFDTFEIYLTD